MNDMKTAINNLTSTSQILEKAANDPRNYNTIYAQHIENMSREMKKMALLLKHVDEISGGF